MSDITPARSNIQQESVRFRSAISEAVLSTVGASINFINGRQYSEKQFFLNGPYYIVAAPQTTMDGLTFFQYDAEIIDVWAFVISNGTTTGQTILDLKLATSTPGGTFNTIFSTTPKIDYNSGNNVWIHVGSTVPYTTAPVLSTTNVSAGNAIRCDLLSVPGGTPNQCGIIIHYRPR